MIGQGGFKDVTYPTDKFLPYEKNIVASFYSRYLSTYDPFYYHGTLGNLVKTTDIHGDPNPDLQYQCKPTVLEFVDVLNQSDMLLKSISSNEHINNDEKEKFFYHGDHLGSASWITDYQGNPVQYIHYAPYGEMIANQRPMNYDERYKFTGKERDRETGYDMFGARYLWSPTGHWLSVDPLAGDYPWISPYAYGLWNPIKYIDPDGRKIVVGTWWGRALAKLGFNNFESKTMSHLQELKNMDPELDKMITKIEESTTEYHINNVEGNGLGYNDKKKEILYNPDSKETKNGRKRPAQVGLAHELGHAENDVDGTTVDFSKRKAEKGDPIERDKCNRNEQNSINKENIVRKKLDCNERPNDYFTTEDY